METENVIKRDFSDAPVAPTATSVRSWLAEKGAKGFISTNAVALIVGVSKRVVKDAERAGELKPVDKCTYPLESVVSWLMRHPRYIAQNVKYWVVTPDTYPKVKAILLRSSQKLIRLWTGDVDDLTAEICYRMTKMPVSSAVSESTVICRTINNLWHEKSTQNRNNTISLDALLEKGVQK